MKQLSKQFKHQSGSSLIIAVLLVGVVSVVSFGISSLTLNDMKLHRLFVGSGESYYGAESALEEALLEVKKDRNYLAAQAVSSGLGKTADNLDIATYTATYFGHHFYKKEIKKDGFVDVLLGGDYSSENEDKLCIVYNSDNNLKSIQIIEDGEITGNYFRASNPIVYPIVYSNPESNPKSIRINSVGSGVKDIYIISISNDDVSDCSSIDTSSSNSLESAIISMTPKHEIDTGFLTIKATGTYQKLNRRLQAKVERSSGALLNIFDFTLYSKGNIE